jgi:beta-glucuronidase
VIEKSLILDVQNWVQKFKKPLIVAEYGADTIAGIHMVK